MVRGRARLPFTLGFLLLFFGQNTLAVPNQQILSSCADISQSGRYHLDRDLRGSVGSACVRIHDVADVHLDCHGHAIATDSRGLAAVVVETVTDFTIQACEIPQVSGYSLFVGNSSGGTLLRNTLKDAILAVPESEGAASLRLVGNRFSEFGPQVFGTRAPEAREDEVIPLQPGLNRLEAQQLSVPAVAPEAPGPGTPLARAPLRVFPNPWRVDRHAGQGIVFDPVTSGASLRLFTLSGRWIKTLDTARGQATWDLTNDAGQSVASGSYFYVVTFENGARTVGELTVIR